MDHQETKSAPPLPIFEGDTVVLSCPKAGGFIFSFPPPRFSLAEWPDYLRSELHERSSFSYNCVSIYPSNSKEPLNVHGVAFQVLPDNVKHKPFVLAQQEISSHKPIPSQVSMNNKLVYGRNIKLLHVASEKYLSYNDNTKAFLGDTPYLFRMLPSGNAGKIRGDTVCTKDDVIIESVTKRGQYVLPVWNTLIESFEVKLTTTVSLFNIIQHKSVYDFMVSPKAIRGGSVVTFFNSKRNTYLCGSGSTISKALPACLQDDNDIQVYAKKNKSSSVPSFSVSSNCLWQLEKPNKPLDGSPFKLGEECLIRHLLTGTYFAFSAYTLEQPALAGLHVDQYFTRNVNRHKTFLVNTHEELEFNNKDCFSGHIIEGSVVGFGFLNKDTEYIQHAAKVKSPTVFELSFGSKVTDADDFKIEKVTDDYLCMLYEVERIKYILTKYFEKKISKSIFMKSKLIEICVLLHNLSSFLVNRGTSAITAKKYVKLLQATQCLNLLVGCLSLDLLNMDKCICQVLKAAAQVRSHKTRLHLAKESFMKIYIKKLGKAVGIEEFLIALAKGESLITYSLVEYLFSPDAITIWKNNLDTNILKLLSKLCFVDGSPHKDIQDNMCLNIIQKDEGILIRVEEIGNLLYCFKFGTNPQDLITLCNNEQDPDLNFLIAQVCFFSALCKGLNLFTREEINKIFPYESVLGKLNRVSRKFASAAYELIAALYLDFVIAEKGTDIDNIWTCFLWDNLIDSQTCKPLEGTHIFYNYMKNLDENEKEIVNMFIKLVEVEINIVEDYEYAGKLLTLVEPLFTYGFCWNITKDEVSFNVQCLSNFLAKLTSTSNETTELHVRDIIFLVQIKTLQLLRIFFKQYIYLYVEQFLYHFHKKQTNGISNVACFWDDLSQQMQSEIKKYSEKVLMDLQKLSEYKLFDFKTTEGQNFAKTLKKIMLSENDELITVSAGLLYDICNKEKLMLDQAELSYIVMSERNGNLQAYNKMISYGSFQGDFEDMKFFLQGREKDVTEKSAKIQDILQEYIQSELIMNNDETIMDTSSRQNIACTSGMFVIVMKYVLKYCPTCYDEQKPFLETCCEFLQMTCRNNHKSKKRIADRLTDFITVKTGVSSVARLLTEVFTDNQSLCYTVTDTSVQHFYQIASTEKNAIEYMEFFTTLQAIMMPCRSTGDPVRIVQKSVIELISSDIHTYQYKSIIKERAMETPQNDDIMLLKLLHLIDLMATCCTGKMQLAQDVCHSFITLEELLEVILNDKIHSLCKIPFVHLLIEAYLNDDRESICSFDKLAHSRYFWNHITNIVKSVNKLSDTKIDNPRIKRMNVFRYQTWNEIFLIEEVDELFLQYFIEGFVPLITEFCNHLVLYQNEIKLSDIKGAESTLRDVNTVLTDLPEKNKSLKTWEKFVGNCLHSINKVLPDYGVLGEDHALVTEKPTINDKESAHKELAHNENLQLFITNYRKSVYQTVVDDTHNGTIINLMPTDELMEQFNTSIQPFVNDVSYQVDDDCFESFDYDQHNEDWSSDAFRSLFVCMNLLHSLYRQMHQRTIASMDRARLHSNIVTTLQILYSILKTMFHKTSITNKNTRTNIQMARTVLIEGDDTNVQSFLKLALKLLSYKNDTVATYIFGLLYLLIYEDEQNVSPAVKYNDIEARQNKFYSYLVEDANFFLRLHQLIVRVVPDLRVTMVPEEIESKCTSTSITIEADPKITRLKLTHEKDREALCRISVILDLISVLCDGQNRKLQDLMMEQSSVMSFNIVSDITALIQTLADIPDSEVTCTSSDYCLIISTKTSVTSKAIQALIELCAGNYLNQQVAINGQIVNSLNLILGKTSRDEGIILVQGKCIELLQVLLEETNVKSVESVWSISNDINEENIVQFIKWIDGKRNKASTDMKRDMHRAYCVLKTIAKRDFADKSLDVWKRLDEETCHVEINYITKKSNEILTQVYFPFEKSCKLTDDQKHKLRDELVRDSHEEKLRSLLKWTDSVWKIYQNKNKKHFKRVLSFSERSLEIRHWILIIITLILNIFILATFEIPSENNCFNSSNDSNSTVAYILIPKTWRCWSTIEGVIFFIFGVFHVVLAVWMVLEYFIEEKPNFNFDIPFLKETVLYLYEKYEIFKILCDVINKMLFNDFFKLEQKEIQSFGISVFGLYTMYRVLFVISSILGLCTYGYFYCLCLPYIFIKLNVIQHIIKAVSGIAKQLIYVALLILCILLIYAVFSFAIMSSFFDIEKNLYCRNLWECYVTVIREGLVHSYGIAIPVTYEGQSDKNFNVYFWRSFIDLSFFVIISVIALEIITALLIDRFSELREKREKAEKDEKEVCFICGISSGDFEKKDTEGKEFTRHYREDHNIYNYIYFVIYVKSIPKKDRNAIEKYVYDKVKNKSIDFFPIKKARV